MSTHSFASLHSVQFQSRRCHGNTRTAAPVWLAALAVAVLVALGSDQLLASLLGLASVNACAFFLFLEWLERRDRR